MKTVLEILLTILLMAAFCIALTIYILSGVLAQEFLEWIDKKKEKEKSGKWQD